MLLLTACGKEVNEFSSADLLGTWTVAQSTFTTYENGVVADTNTEKQVGTMTFNEDGTGIFVQANEKQAITWASENGKVIVQSLSGKFNHAFEVVSGDSSHQEWFSKFDSDATGKTLTVEVSFVLNR